MPEITNFKHRPATPSPISQRGHSRFAYAELDVTSNFSFLRGASHPDELVYRAAELGHQAIALTDLNSLAGIVRAHQAAEASQIKLCVGSRLCFTDAPDVLVWAENRTGYANLCRLLTLGKRRAEKGFCTLHLHDLLNAPTGLSAALVPQRIDPELDPAHPDFAPFPGTPGQGTGGGLSSLILRPSSFANAPHPAPPPEYERSEWNPRRGDNKFSPSAFIDAAEIMKQAFGSAMSIAVSRHGSPLDEPVLAELIALSQRFAIPLVATNQVHYHTEGRQPLQDVLTCIRHGCTIREAGFKLFPNAERFIKSPEEMHQLFADMPRALQRTIEIAERCNFSLNELCYEYPDEIVPPGQTPASYLAELAWRGAAERYLQGTPEKVRQQIAYELTLIEKLKIEPYFLTVYDLVRFARSKDILCQGRGSAANSAVCFCLGVTSVDPNRIDVLFERFVSTARNEPPDIDIDFEHERREEVIQYVYEKYGRERAGMTAEIISYRGRSAVRDVGKAMGLGLDAVDSLAKRLAGWHSGIPVESQIKEAGLDPADPTVRLVMNLTHQLLGFPRHLSQHVGGMVMTRLPLCELVPIENASMPNRTVIEWDKDDIDALHILKVDILALGMLTALAKGIKLINQTHPQNPPLQLHSIPAEDPGVYEMASDADTVGVFQIESRAQMSMLPRLKPKEFYDLVIEVAIVRPGPIQGDMVHPYLRRRMGIEKVTFPKPELEAVLGKTLGVPLFQEQAMRVAIVAAGFTPEQADRLRRAVTGFRRYGDIDTFAQQFVNGMVQRGYQRDFAERCFAQLKGFSTYGFPESHAASFALLVYASCWIKRYHPAAFCCALLNSQPMGFYAPAQIVRDAQQHGVCILPIDVNHSDWDCTLEQSCAGTNMMHPSCLAAALGQRVPPSDRPHKHAAQMPPLSAEGKNPPPPANTPNACGLALTLEQFFPLALNEVAEVVHDLHTSAASPPTQDKHTWGHAGPAVRLGLRMIKGLAQSHADKIMHHRRAHGPFHSIDDFHAAAQLPISAVAKLSQADAFGSLPKTRRAALWETLALPDERKPLIAPLANTDSAVGLIPMTKAQEIRADYGTTGLSLKGHPVALVRNELNRRKIIPAIQTPNCRHGKWISVAGIVIIRQRPGTAKGIIFITLEDETGIVNLIIHPGTFERFRPAILHAKLLQADGPLERVNGVQHLIAMRLHDLNNLIGDCDLRSRDFH